MKITIFPGKYHQNGGFSMAMLVSGRVKRWKNYFEPAPIVHDRGKKVPKQKHHCISLIPMWMLTGWCSTPTLLLICSSFSKENGYPFLICSSLSTAQLSFVKQATHSCNKTSHFKPTAASTRRAASPIFFWQVHPRPLVLYNVLRCVFCYNSLGWTRFGCVSKCSFYTQNI